jgi:hypothetical protein
MVPAALSGIAAVLFAISFILDVSDQGGDVTSTLDRGGFTLLALALAAYFAVGRVRNFRPGPEGRPAPRGDGL